MTSKFSLPTDPFSPIRPLKVELLFSPCSNKRRAINDMTYRVPNVPHSSEPKPPEVFIDVDVTNLNLPSYSSKKTFPRQSTAIKKPPNFATKENGPNYDDEIEQINSTKFEDARQLQDQIPEYKPFYRLKDSQPIRTTCFHPFGDAFVVGTNSRKLLIYPYPCNNEFDTFYPTDEPTEPKYSFQFEHIHQGSIYCAAFNEEGNLLATGSNDQSVHIVRYDAKSQFPTGDENVLQIHSGTVRDVRFLSSMYLLSAGAGNFGINVTDVQFKKTRVLQSHTETVMSLHTWDDPNLFVSASLDSTIRIWDTRTMRSVHVASTTRPGGDEGDANKGTPSGVVRVDHTGKLLVSGHEDGRCMLYDIRGGRVLQLFKAHEKEVRAMNFSPKTYYLLTGSYDKKIMLTDLQNELSRKLPTVELAEQNDKVIQLAWHPTEYNFTSTCAEGSATLWALPNSYLNP